MDTQIRYEVEAYIDEVVYSLGKHKELTDIDFDKKSKEIEESIDNWLSKKFPFIPEAIYG